MREIAIVGIGIHKFGRFDGKPYAEIGREAARMALKDANMSWRDIEAGYVAEMYLPATSGARILAPLGRTGIPIADVEAACASGGVALRQGIIGIQSGQFDNVLVLGVEKMTRGFMDPSMLYEKWQIQMGLSTNPSYWAMKARRHMEEYGTTDLHIAKVAYKNHKNSVLNPYAMYQKAFSIEEILNSPMVCDPIHLLEICAPNEGAAAVVLCPKEKARRYTSKPIMLSSCIHTIAQYASDFRVPSESMSTKIVNPGPTAVAGKKAYAEAGVGPEDIDIAEVQDTDAFCEMEVYEELGFCKPGESGRLVDEGETEIGGRIPINVSGGLICKGEPVGASHLGQVFEVVLQLRGEAGARQVPDCKVGLAHVIGAGGNCAVTIMKK
ncbi:MAG: thiolase family protein [Deltaproteobacteria bacterium]|nr:thiolase family protein [Deltaproteobacteria bacterium]